MENFGIFNLLSQLLNQTFDNTRSDNTTNDNSNTQSIKNVSTVNSNASPENAPANSQSDIERRKQKYIKIANQHDELVRRIKNSK